MEGLEFSKKNIYCIAFLNRICIFASLLCIINMKSIDNIPHILKYMGSKREILNFVGTAIHDLNVNSRWLCDLFAGTSIISAAFNDEYNVISNDIQEYSSILAKMYSLNLKEDLPCDFSRKVVDQAEFLKNEWINNHKEFNFKYDKINIYNDLKMLERNQQDLINRNFNIGFNFFTKNYSGTYWSYDQCVWIDSIRAIAEKYKETSGYYAIISALIFAMSYSSQSTGHFAQFRDVTESNMDDILLYRNKQIRDLFTKKMDELISVLDEKCTNKIKVTSLDYLDCLRTIENNTIVYADPPYSNVHYSRFYHVIETLVRYDNPVLKYKGRYREDRYQSVFDKKSQVKDAFKNLFIGIKEKKSHLVLSYSNNGLISEDDLLEIAKDVLGKDYLIDVRSKNYIHSKMGRADENRMNVNELLILFKRVIQ
jgi:adenine-specific DNA-methyltransferase